MIKTGFGAMWAMETRTRLVVDDFRAVRMKSGTWYSGIHMEETC